MAAQLPPDTLMKTSVDDLPDEVLTLIFEKCVSDLKSLSEVSPRFCFLAGSFVKSLNVRFDCPMPMGFNCNRHTSTNRFKRIDQLRLSGPERTPEKVDESPNMKKYSAMASSLLISLLDLNAESLKSFKMDDGLDISLNFSEISFMKLKLLQVLAVESRHFRVSIEEGLMECESDMNCTNSELKKVIENLADSPIFQTIDSMKLCHCSYSIYMFSRVPRFQQIKSLLLSHFHVETLQTVFENCRMLESLHASLLSYECSQGVWLTFTDLHPLVHLHTFLMTAEKGEVTNTMTKSLAPLTPNVTKLRWATDHATPFDFPFEGLKALVANCPLVKELELCFMAEFEEDAFSTGFSHVERLMIPKPKQDSTNLKEWEGILQAWYPGLQICWHEFQAWEDEGDTDVYIGCADHQGGPDGEVCGGEIQEEIKV